STHIGQPISYDFCEQTLSKNEDGTELIRLVEDEQVFRYFKQVLPHRSVDESWVENKAQVIQSCFDNGGIEATLPKEELANAQIIIEAYRKAKKRIIARTVFSQKKKKYVRDLLEKQELPDDETGLDQLMQRIDNRMNLEHNLTQLDEAEWMIEIPTSYNHQDFEDWLEAYRKALRGKRLFTGFRQVTENLPHEQITFVDLKEYFVELFELLDKIPQKQKIWQQYLKPKQIRWVLEDSQNAEKLSTVLKKDFDDICEFDKVRDQFRPKELEVVGRLKVYYGYFDPERTLSLFENSLRLAWLNHLEEEKPILRAISSLKLPQAEQELQEAVKEKYALSSEILLLKLREQTYKNVKYNRLRNRTTYRGLEHQVKKKRSLWALRKLITEFADEVFDLVPCWLASPESVSAIFPMKQLFDLVIFDEASQCYAEKGLPAIYRASQTIIVGDDKQLPPHNLYRPRWEEDGENPSKESVPELEVDSLLDLGKQFIKEHSLWGHYRSQALELIDFSNQHFYAQRLSMVPNFEQYQAQNPAISYVRVDGVWHQNSNQSEVMEVARLVKELVQSGETSVGVITFNFKQQEAIRDLFELTEFKLPEDFFIKNIENVQGDERDVIIFSVGYAPDTQGKLRAQFGLLNLQGGENRLNVAVTRARKRIIIVSSILPQDLDVENAQNAGPKLLKAYLEYAHRVSSGTYKASFAPRKPHAETWYLKEKLKDENLNADLPFADLTGESNALVRTDDEHYYESLSVKDWHVYRPELLKRKNWKFEDQYSRNFWLGKETHE
ncbi:MAG: DEAD/DEAH box helicase, partial [Bacteroidota bacterium]